MSEFRRVAREIAGPCVVEGYQRPSEIEQLTIEIGAETDEGVGLETEEMERVAREVVAELMDEQRERERGWTELTDCDRIDKAFEALEADGVLARQRFGETQRDGFDRMLHEELPMAREAGHATRGFTFFNAQTTEGAVETGTLTLSYGAADMDHERSVKIANDVVAALLRFGLDASWGGSLEERILVTRMDWRRRRFADSTS